MTPVPAYPGPAAVFEHTQGDWTFTHNRLRSLHFRSTVKDSTIYAFSLQGHRDGQIALTFVFPESKVDYDRIYDFFEANQVKVMFPFFRKLSTLVITGTDHATLKIAFRILAENNKIPDSHLKQIEEIITEGSCSPWMPTDLQRDQEAH